MEEKQRTMVLPMVALRGLTLFPNTAISFPVSRQKSLDALQAAEENEGKIFVVTQKESANTSPKKDELFGIGTIAVIKQVLKLPGNMTHVIVEGRERGRLEAVRQKALCDYAKVKCIGQDFPEEPDDVMRATMRVALEEYEGYLQYVANSSATELMNILRASKKPGHMSDVMASALEIEFTEKQALLETLHPMERIYAVIGKLKSEKRILDIKKEIEQKTKAKIEQSQREYYLREELKIIQEELGNKDGVMAEVEKYRQMLAQKHLPKQAEETLSKEIERIVRIPASAPEANVSRNYIETLLALPWDEHTEDGLNLQEAEDILNEDHYGMEKVKNRVIEYLAVRQKAPIEEATILCLVGPPGVGKTSIAKSIAKAINRKYIRMSLGGVKDESEIRGHRKTYIGAMPGRIMNAMKQVGVINPLMLLDEIDKLGISHNGDPAAALLEVLDAEQNNTFRDHYVEVPYDLSKVLFMCTANSTDTIPKPLLDRMEVIQLESYTSQEKFHIAKDHLVKKQRKRHGLTAAQCKIKDDAIHMMIEGYTRESGVRQLERVMGKVCRKVVKKLLSEKQKQITVSAKNLEELIGKRKYQAQKAYEESQVGVVRGLAWTSVGGTTLSVEVNVMDGEGKFKLTGNVGKVMEESAEAAISYIRSHCTEYELQDDFYKNKDIHIHIPEGATPKDGPSAGITMSTAILSALTGTKVRNDVAMTGEVTIRGRVLAIGGLQEKILAAKKIGIHHIVLPWENERDLLDVKEEIKEGMEFTLAKTMNDVLDVALVKGEHAWK